MQIEMPYPISTNRYWRNFRGRPVVSKEAKDYRREIALRTHQNGLYAPIDGPVRVDATLHPKKPLKPSKSEPRCIDIDNALKVMLDALQGIAYENDSQVREIHIKRGEPVEGGALIVTVAPRVAEA